ncbi:uncharacterized protein LOC134540292 [Bacillus rossius redtenbacheri]|uniref:uncharacterized protein LOC134540292 n=1 Tax=Bacillus rossius redtenbacheri TaxID=93214 RepID=UPI002FDE1E12
MKAINSLASSSIYLMNSMVIDYATISKGNTPSIARAFVIISDNDKREFFTKSMSEIMQSPLFSCKAFFLFVLTEQLHGFPGNAEEILRRCWTRYEALHCVLLSSHGRGAETSSDVQALSFNPFEPNGSFTQTSMRTSQEVGGLFSEVLPDVNGYPLVVSFPNFPPFVSRHASIDGHNEFSGMFYNYINIFFEKYNFTFTERSGGKPEDAGRWCTPESYGREFDVFGFPDVMSSPQQLRCSAYPMLICPFAVIVPAAEELPRWMNFALPFTWGTWAAYLGFLSSTVAVCKLVQWSCPSPARQLDGLEMFRAMQVGNILHVPKTNSLRIFLLSVILFSIIFNNAYTGSFHSHMMLPEYSEDIDTVEELTSRAVMIGVPLSFEDGVQFNFGLLDDAIADDDPFMMRLVELFVPVDSTRAALGWAKTWRNASVASARTYAEYLVSLEENLNNRQLLHIMDEYITMIIVYVKTRLDFPFVDQLSSTLQLIQQIGVGVKNYRELISTFGKHGKKLSLGENDTPLSLKHLQYFFKILLAGAAVSTSVFLTENFVSWQQKRFLRTRNLPVISVKNHLQVK